MSKVVEYARPHHMSHSYMHGLETGVANQETIYPIMLQDEGLGTPSAYEAHPENAAFVEAGEPNCFTDSRVDIVLAELRFSLTKALLETDKVHTVRVGYMPIFTAFKEDLTAIDDLTGLETQDVLELQSEDTDKQAFPLYNNVKMVESFAGSGTLAVNVDGLTTTQIIEGVTFKENQYYDMLHYLTNGNKLKTLQGGLKWIILTKDRPHRKIRIRLRRKVKAMNKFTFFGCMTTVPAAGGLHQFAVVGDTTNVNHVRVDWQVRFNEWNHDFNNKRV